MVDFTDRSSAIAVDSLLSARSLMSTNTEFENQSQAAVVHRILVVDDDADTVTFLRAVLGQNGYDVFVAKDGGQAHSMFTMRQPDFVILDLMLPGNETGFEICERLKEMQRQIPVVILSAIDLPRARNLAERVGADAFLNKPISPDELLSQIRATADMVFQRTIAEAKPAQSTQAVRFACRCGKRFKVSEQHRGKTLTCPNCGEPVIVPRHD